MVKTHAKPHRGAPPKAEKTKRQGLKKVFICSPYRSNAKNEDEQMQEIERNIFMAQDACRCAALEGYVPYAPHLYFPQFLNDDDPEEREKGIIMGLSWLTRCDEL